MEESGTEEKAWHWQVEGWTVDCANKEGRGSEGGLAWVMLGVEKEERGRGGKERRLGDARRKRKER